MSGGTSRLRLRSLAPEDGPELKRIHGSEEVARWWDQPEDEFPFEDETTERLVIEIDGTVAGMVQFEEEEDPKYRHASVDLFLDPSFHGRGLGTEAVRQVVGMLIEERGHHRITIDPAAGNTAAIRAYTKAGFRRVGVMHKAERDSDGDSWHDQLLMELVSDQPPEATRTGGAFEIVVVPQEQTAGLGRLLEQFNREFDCPTPPAAVLESRLRELIAGGDTVGLLAEPGPVGLAVLRFRRSIWSEMLECTLAELYVIPEERGRGIGRALLDRSLELARARGADNVELNTSDLDTAARRLYEAMGFSNLEGPERNASMLYYEREL